MKKIVRSVCYFAHDPSEEIVGRLTELSDRLTQSGYLVQSRRLCSPDFEKVRGLAGRFSADQLALSVGSLTLEKIHELWGDLILSKDIFFNLDLSAAEIGEDAPTVLLNLIKQAPGKTFDFAYVFNNCPETPFFPSASYRREGFSIGLQSTDLASGCVSLDEWHSRQKEAWQEIANLFSDRPDFLGLDSSVAPLFNGDSSLINFVQRLFGDFESSVTSDFYLRLTQFLKSENPKPVGLCGLMLPCLEDFELAKEYEKGNFSLERNLFLSLHSGVGVDTYPIGVDESLERVAQILGLVQRLSYKHQKPLSVRLVSDGQAKIGQKTNFNNPYLKDVVVRKL